MSILKKLQSGGRHTVTVPLEIEEESGVKTKGTLRVAYRGVSYDEAEQMEARMNANPNKREALIGALCENVLSIEEDGEKVEPDAAFFGGMDTYFLNRINAAIKKDRDGPNE